MQELNTGLGYRYDVDNAAFSYISGVVVQFDLLQNKTSVFAKIEHLLDSAIKSHPRKFRAKRLAFGDGDILPGVLLDIDQFDNVDFVLEHRNKTPNDECIFFSIAPMKTAEHIALLEKIEQDLIA
jgi:hypothetical protein